MAYKVFWDKRVVEDLKSHDKSEIKLLIDKINLALSKVPEGLGKQMDGIFNGLMAYEAGAFKAIYYIDKKEETITILRVGRTAGG